MKLDNYIVVWKLVTCTDILQWRRKMFSSRGAENGEGTRGEPANLFLNITYMASHSFAHLGCKKCSAARCMCILAKLIDGIV